ncbi:ataxin-2 isoform X4 [Conger conger]|uniref:ataxin-2 isoform X4 n=1 Tax=Conger conger TaxID=82655 RepID=UPI002A5A3784|nr:ataxin-2 isoform X4 [Conger conger]
MSMKQAGGNRKPGGGSGGAAAASAAGGGGGPGGRQNLGRGRNSVKGPSSPAIAFNGVYANMRMVHVLTSVVGTKCELKVKNGVVYEGVFKTYGPECDLVLDAAHRKSSDPSLGPRREDIVESIIFKASDVVVVQFKDVDLNYARKVSSETADNFTDSAVSVGARVNGEHKEKDLEPWDAGEPHVSDSLESLDTDVSNGWDPNDMFKFNEENYGVKSTYDSSLASYTVPLERDNSEEFLKREARAAQLAEEIESSATYRARVALENDDRSEEEKFTAVVRGEREPHALNSSREHKYVPPGQRSREGVSWGAGRQNSPRLAQGGSGPPPASGPPPPRPAAHDYSPSGDQRVVNGVSCILICPGASWPSPCPSPSSRPPSRYQSGPSSSSLPPRASTPTRPPPRPPSRPSRPPSHPSAHGCPAPVSPLPKRMSSAEGPLRMSPKTQRTPRTHRLPAGRGGAPGVDYISHNASGDVSAPPPARSSPSGGTWSSVVSGAHRPRSPRQSSLGGTPTGPASMPSPQPGTAPIDPVTTPTSGVSPTAASPASNRAVTPSAEAKESRIGEARQNSPAAGKDGAKPSEASPSVSRPGGKGPPSMAPDHRKQLDNLKKFSVDFRLQPSSTPDPPFDQMMTKPPRDAGDKSKGAEPVSKGAESATKGAELGVGEDPTPLLPAVGVAGSSKPASPASSSSPSSSSSGLCPAPEQKRGPDVTSQGVQTSSPGSGGKMEGKDDKEEKKDPVPEQVRKSTLNPNAKEFNPRAFCSQPKPATTPTPPRPQGQPSPSMVVPQPPTVYSQTVCFPQMYPLTPVSPGVQVSPAVLHHPHPHTLSPGLQKSIIWKPPAMYHVQVPHMAVSQSKAYRAVPSMPQQRPDQHHPQATPTMMHPATAAGPPIVAPSPAYSAQYFTACPQQFSSPPLVQQMPHYQSQAQHVFSPVMQGGARMMAPPTHGQPSLVSSSTTQYGEQTHTMYACNRRVVFAVSPGPIPQQYTHPNATLHPHPQHPQPSATPTGQQQPQGQHTGNHPPAPSPVQHAQHQAAQALHLGTPPQQPLYSALAPTPPSLTPGPNPQSPQTSYPSAQQVYIHPQQVQHGYTASHMAHVQQAHMQSGMVPSHHATPTHPPMMLMATQPPGGPQGGLPQSALPPPIPVSSAHFSYMAHPPVQPHHQQQL